MATVAIIHVSRLPSAEPTRQGKTDAVVIYSVDNGAPSSIIVPDEDATDDKLPGLIKAQLDKTARLIGKSFTLD